LLLGVTACLGPSVTNGVAAANRKAEAEGSPFRWKAKSIPGGSMLVRVLADLPSGPSRADPQLKHDTLDLIAKMEKAAGRSEPEVEDVKLLSDGKELWLLHINERDGVAYIVDFRPSAVGGTDIGLSKPLSYAKDPAQ
jgi:hypothetical protein